MKHTLNKVLIVLLLLVSNVLYAQRDPSGIDQMLENLATFLVILFVLVIIGTVLIIVYVVNRKNRKTVRENQELKLHDSVLTQVLPHSTLILVFGILSILTSCFIIIGLPLGIVALILAIKATKLNAENAEAYTGIQNVRIGKVLAIIGIIFNGFYVVKFMFPFMNIMDY